MNNTQKTFALILGIVLLLVGIWGFFTTSILGIFGVNMIQSVIHVIVGLLGIYAGTKGMGYGYNMAVGWGGIVLGILGFVPGVDSLLMSLLNINTAITVLHLVIGVVCLAVYYGVSKE
ncbi:MAG: DUF4383 domain-containing protein [Nanoarchaeota archaeon]